MITVINKIQRKLSNKSDVLAELRKLPNSELNSFLLELFRLKSLDISPPELLNHFRNNRFVSPSDMDLIKIRETETEYLKYARKKGFKAVLLSPLAPFGSCSSMGFVNQNNIVSALRGTEVLSDATNILALKIADDFKEKPNKEEVVNYATSHRHVRGQYFTNPNFSVHFTVFCMASGGFDTGNFKFEFARLNEHLRFGPGKYWETKKAGYLSAEPESV